MLENFVAQNVRVIRIVLEKMAACAMCETGIVFLYKSSTCEAHWPEDTDAWGAIAGLFLGLGSIWGGIGRVTEAASGYAGRLRSLWL